MPNISPLKEQLTKALIRVALASCHYLNEQYQHFKKEVEQSSDHELFEFVQRLSSPHLKRLLATIELMNRGYLLSEILEAAKDK
ncbi:hypothetical protein CSB62_19080 [Vibrio splendidus]|nr:hypothetical protein A152_18865 [Vibrio tasmaniensis 1F-187]PHN84544.1 hypothetical protein CSB62_19080 [Vibrio splendidus]